jgi:hypothetical protein
MSNLVAEIRAAYEQDQQRRGEKLVSREQLPLSFEDVTDEWLADVLCRDHPGAAVVTHRLGPPDNGSANRRKIHIEYNPIGREAGLPEDLFCKASQDLVNRTVLGVSGAANVETTFYRLLRPLLDIEAPRPYFAKFDPQTFNSMIMLGDLSVIGTQFCSHETVMTRPRLESQLSLLARVHGQCMSNPALKERLPAMGTWSGFFKRSMGFGLKDGSNKGFLDAESVIPPRIFRRYEEVWPAMLRSVELDDRLPKTLSHGDVHLKNWYITAKDQMGLGDWQCSSQGHWGRDLAYTIVTALNVEDRRRSMQELILFYLDQLRASGGPAVGFEEAWQYCRQHLMSVLTWWTVTLSPPPGLPDMQPRDITLEFVRRIAVAIDDMDSLDSV